MAKAWIENGNIYVAYSEDVVPKGVEAVEVSDNTTPSDLVIDAQTGQLRLKTEQEKLAEEKQRKLDELKRHVAALLSQTDYVVIKISEAETLGDTETAEQLKQKYETQLQQRQAIRQWSEQMKQAIQNAKTIEELEAIKIEFEG